MKEVETAHLWLQESEEPHNFKSWNSGFNFWSYEASKLQNHNSENITELWEYFAHASCKLEIHWLDEAMQQRTASSSILAHLVWPFVCKWKPESRLTYSLSAEQNSFQMQVNCQPQSKTMSEGVPCELKMCLLSNWAVLRAERSFGRDTMGSSWKPINVEYNWLPDEGGRPNTIWGHGWPGVGRGLNSWTASGYKLNKQARANIFGQWWPPEQTL